MQEVFRQPAMEEGNSVHIGFTETGLERENGVTESWEVPGFRELKEGLPNTLPGYFELFDFKSDQFGHAGHRLWRLSHGAPDAGASRVETGTKE